MKNVRTEKRLVAKKILAGVVIALIFVVVGIDKTWAANYKNAFENPLVKQKMSYIEPIESISSPLSSNDSRVNRSSADSWEKELIITALGQDFHLLLNEFNGFNKNLKVNIVGGGAEQRRTEKYYSGVVKEMAGTWVRLEIDGAVIRGSIHTPYDVYVIEPGEAFISYDSDKTARAASGSVMYKMSDVGTGLPENFCGVEAGNKQSDELQQESDNEYVEFIEDIKDDIKMAASYSGGSTTEMKELKIGMIVDYEFYQKYGSNSVAKLESIANQLDGIYRNDLKIALNITSITVFTESEDPFSDTTDSYALLREVGAYASARAEFSSNGLNHFISGKDFDSNIIGLAYVDTVCDGNRYATSITQSYESFYMSQILVSAHEIGHNLGATHDSSEDGRYIMWPSASSSVIMNFSDRTQGQIEGNKNLSCFSSTADVSLEMSYDDILQENDQEDSDEENNNEEGDLVKVTSQVENLSSIDASGVELSISIPSGVEVVSYNEECSYNSSVITCEIGVMGAGDIFSVNVIIELVDGVNYDRSDIYSSSGMSSLVVSGNVTIDGTESFSSNNSDNIQIPLEYGVKDSGSSSSSGGGGGVIDIRLIVLMMSLIMALKVVTSKGEKLVYIKTNQTNLK